MMHPQLIVFTVLKIVDEKKESSSLLSRHMVMWIKSLLPSSTTTEQRGIVSNTVRSVPVFQDGSGQRRGKKPKTKERIKDGSKLQE